MATPTDETSFLHQVLSWVAGGIAAVGVWLWTSTMSRIKDLEQTKLSKDAFDEYVTRAEKDRDERREAEVNLFGKVDDLHRHFDSKIDKLTDLVRELRR